MSSSPIDFEKYNSVLSRNKGFISNEVKDGGPTPKMAEDDELRQFNESFIDIKEILSDNGIPVTTMRTEAVYRPGGAKKDKFSDYSLLLRRTYEHKSQKKPELQLEIRSKRLQSEFAKLASKLTSIKLNHDPIVIRYPFREIYFARVEIRQAIASAEQDVRLWNELQLLSNFQKQYMKETFQMIEQFLTSGYIEYDWLWALFPPEEEVVIENRFASDKPIQWCATIKSFEYADTKKESACCKFTFRYTGFNGIKFGTITNSLKLPAFSDTVVISQLPVYPVKFHLDKDRLKREAISRGKHYEKYCRASERGKSGPAGSTVLHRGPIWTQREDQFGMREEQSHRGCRITDHPSRTIQGRAIVDFEGFYAQKPIFREALEPESREENVDDSVSINSGSDHDYPLRSRRNSQESFLDTTFVHSDNPLEEKQHLTCPPLIPIFSLTTKQWCFAYISDLKEINWQKGLLDNLQIDNKLKIAVRELLNGFTSNYISFDDFIEGKGHGLVILIHGPPGSGKTMTAESMSEYLQKPLYHINGGDLGLTVDEIQRSLEEVFDRIKRWDAILLLDEAEAFLAKRRSKKIDRNALISVFLRLIEYQSGIVFLTTNRLEDIDSAFESRIHLQIKYPPLDSVKRAKIWSRLAGHGKCKLSEAQAEGLGTLETDGRRIKNILRMASLGAAERVRKGKEAVGGGSSQYIDEKMTYDDILKVLPWTITHGEGTELRKQVDNLCASKSLQ